MSQTFEASQSIPYLPGTVNAPVLGPTLFNFMGRPAQVNGIPILANNMIIPSVHEVATGNSYGTKIVYNGITLPKKQEKNEGKIQFNLSGRAFGQVVGSITIQSRKNKGDEVDLSTLIYDTAMYIGERKDLKSYNVTLLSVPQGISYAMGVDSKGNGFSLSPVISGLINGPTGVMAGAASGLASSRGITAPTGLIGCTFLVLIESENAVGVDLLANYTNGFSQKDQDENNGNGNGNGHKNGNGVKKKKYDSVEK
ncbi:MAG: hypothetical protein HGA77_10205 [Chlorobiaceae bacterium]|nr:hypothetical protein [Chlorobiaceae bacterium]